MKAYLLAAGRGTRLRPHTDRRPKCLMPIHGKPLLQIWLELLERSGISAVLVNTHHLAGQVEAFLAAWRRKSCLDVRTVYEPRLLGSAGTIWTQRGFIDGRQPFVIAYADTLSDIDLGRMLTVHRGYRRRGALMTMGLMPAPDPKACGIAVLDSHNRIIQFIEKPEHPVSRLANGGIYIASPEIFGYFNGFEKLTNQRAVDLGYDLLPRLVGRMYGYPIREYVRDIGTPAAYQQALAEWPLKEKNG